MNLIKQIRQYFHRPTTLLQQVLDKIDICRKTGDNCILHITPTSVIFSVQPVSAPPVSIALIPHDRIGDFQKTLLQIETHLINNGHYCIFKLAEDKSYATAFIYVDEAILK